MSTHIIDQLAAIRIPQARSGWHEDYIVLAAEGGDNNLIDTQTRKRVRSWYAIAVGAPWQVMGALVRYSSSMEGGMLRLADNSHATAETLISRARRSVNHALDYDDPAAPIYLRETAITFTDAEKPAYPFKYQYEKLLEAKRPHQRVKKYLRGEVDAFPFDLTEAREFAAFLDFIPEPDKALWHHFEVRPRL